MERAPYTRGSIVIVVLLLLSALAGMYVGGYFLLGNSEKTAILLNDGRWMQVRTFRWDWCTTFYQPMARIESAATGKQVMLLNAADRGWTSYPPLSK